MGELFPYANILAGSLVLIVGFGIHWLNQLSIFLHWELMPKDGFGIHTLANASKYDRFVAVSDVTIGWIYGVIGIGLFMGTSWGYLLAWIPGLFITFEGISYWIVTGKKNLQGIKYSYFNRIEWSTLNIVTGLFILFVAWNAM